MIKKKNTNKGLYVNLGIIVAIVSLLNLLRVPYLLWKDTPYLPAQVLETIGLEVLLPSLLAGVIALLLAVRGLREYSRLELTTAERNTIQNFNIICIALAIISIIIMIFAGILIKSTSNPGFLGWESFSAILGIIFKIAVTAGVLIFIVYACGQLYRAKVLSK